MAVADTVPAGHRLDQRQPGRQRHHRAQPEVRRRTDLGDGREPVHRQAGPAQVVVRLRQQQRRRGVREMPHLGPDPGPLGVPEGGREAVQLGLHGRVARLVGGGEVRPEADHADQPLGLRAQRGGHQLGPVVRLTAVPAEAGVGLQVHPPGHAGLPDGGQQLVQRPETTDRDVDPGPQRLPPGPTGRPQPAQHPRLLRPDPRRPQRERLLGRRRTQPADPGRNRLPGTPNRAVAVGVRLDHSHQRGAAGTLPQRGEIAPQRGQIDGRLGAHPVGEGGRPGRVRSCHRVTVSQTSRGAPSGRYPRGRNCTQPGNHIRGAGNCATGAQWRCTVAYSSATPLLWLLSCVQRATR